jgi:alkylation response protein AidB-like acyl-CoA dehydrogenase
MEHIAHHDRSAWRFMGSRATPETVFTREDLTPEQQLYGQTAAAFMRNEVLPHEGRLYAHDWELTRKLLRRAGELDLLRLEIPEAFGGLGLDKISAAYVAEQLAVNPSFAGSIGAHTGIGMMPLICFGNAEQKAKYLPRLASGELVAAYALTEPGSGSDALAARTTATLTPDGKHYLLRGRKMWITNGGFADLFTLFAKIDGDKFTGFLVERGMGVVSGRDEEKLGLDGSSTTELILEDVKVPVENVLGRIGEGHRVALNTLNLGRVKLGTRNMSGAKRALGNAVRYALERRQFGKAIAEFGLIRRKLAEMWLRCWVGEAMSYRTLGEVDKALAEVDPADAGAVLATIERFAIECSINKVFTSEALGYVVDEALQVYGGNGYSREFPAERAYRDARITRIYEGTNEINRMTIVNRLLKAGLPPEPAAEAAADAEANGASDGDGALAAERKVVADAKRLGLRLLGAAAGAYGPQIREQQEILAHIADVIIEVYAMDSGLARAEKLQRRGAPGREVATAIDMMRVFVADASDRIVHAGKQVQRALAGAGATAEGAAGLLASLAAAPGLDTIAARRRISDEVIRAHART